MSRNMEQIIVVYLGLTEVSEYSSYLALYLAVLYKDRGHCVILGLEPDVVFLFIKSLNRGFVFESIDSSYYYIAVFRCALALNQNKISVHDAGIDH